MRHRYLSVDKYNCIYYLFLGELDHIPEVAFYMVGNIEEVLQKAERLADEKKWMWKIHTDIVLQN